MTLPRLHSRLAKVEAQRRPAMVAAVLRRVRQCAPEAVGAFLLAELTGMERATFDAIMEQLTDAELEALVGDERYTFLHTLPTPELEALARGAPAATRCFEQAFQRWQRHGRV